VASRVAICCLIDAGEEAFDIPPLPGGSGWTGEHKGLVVAAVGLCPSLDGVNWGAVGRFAKDDGDECGRRWLKRIRGSTGTTLTVFIE
jgi:hypothetical protein